MNETRIGEGLLLANTKAVLEAIVKKCFENNRLVDRIVSLLTVKFVMPNTSNIIHQKIAHYYPILADEITDYMAQRNCTAIYGETMAGNQDYAEPIDCFNRMLEINLALEDVVKNAIIVCSENGDYTTKVFLDGFLRNLIPLTDDLLLLVDKATMYSNVHKDLMAFDYDINRFGIGENR